MDGHLVATTSVSSRTFGDLDGLGVFTAASDPQRRPGLLRGPAARGHLLGSAARWLLVNLELLRRALESGGGVFAALPIAVAFSPRLLALF